MGHCLIHLNFYSSCIGVMPFQFFYNWVASPICPITGYNLLHSYIIVSVCMMSYHSLYILLIFKVRLQIKRFCKDIFEDTQRCHYIGWDRTCDLVVFRKTTKCPFGQIIDCCRLCSNYSRKSSLKNYNFFCNGH